MKTLTGQTPLPLMTCDRDKSNGKARGNVSDKKKAQLSRPECTVGLDDSFFWDKMVHPPKKGKYPKPFPNGYKEIDMDDCRKIIRGKRRSQTPPNIAPRL